jgi:hypothetical protein
MTNMTPAHESATVFAGTKLTKDGEVDRRQFNPGRPEGTGVLDDIKGRALALRMIAEKNGFYHYADRGAPVSRVLTLQLVQSGLVTTHKAKVTEGPGRAKLFYKLTEKGSGVLRFTKHWKL